MRTVVVLLSVLSLASLLGGCAREPEGESASVAAPPAQDVPAATAAQAPPSIAAAPRMGGTLVATGDYAVELVASANGNVDAAVTTAAGEAVGSADVAALQVTAQGEGQARHSIALTWDAPRALFHGAAQAGARLVSGPMEMSCSIRGKAVAGRLDMLVALPSPRFGGRMVALGRYSAEIVPKVDGEVNVHVQDAAGAAVAADSGLALSLRAMGKAGLMHGLALRWDTPHACFSGKLQAGAELAPGPFELTARAAGELDLVGRIDAIALLAPPSLGGTMIATADYTVEIVPQLDGQVDAIVRNSAGATLEGGVDLEARVQAGGQLRPVKLVWDPALLRFRGKLEGDFKIEPGPIEIAVLAQGRLRTGSIMAAAVVPSIAADAEAKLDANASAKLNAKAKARLPAIKGKASSALNAKVAANVPKPSVNVKAGGQADAKASGSAQARTTGSTAAKASAKQQGGVKLGGSLSSGISIGTR